MYEIERKFLLDELPPETADTTPTRIDQGYLAVTDDVEVRIRAHGDDRLLTVKGGRGEVRTEVTLPLSREEFDDLWALTAGRRISKRRWTFRLDPDPEVEIEVEVDRFEGALEGLLIAEVEFASEGASRQFVPPDWFGREVTDDDGYRNAALATRPSPG